jgi:hypothetical protein
MPRQLSSIIDKALTTTVEGLSIKTTFWPPFGLPSGQNINIKILKNFRRRFGHCPKVVMLRLGLAWIPRLRLGFLRLGLGKMSSPSLGPNCAQLGLGLGSGRGFQKFIIR